MDQLAAWGRTALYVLEIACGIGFLILIHEFGHFILAKAHKVKVEVFSLGMGPVLCSFRRGFGFQRGSSVKEYEEILKAEAEGVQRKDLPGETEYRLSWLLPLGGYVKMAGEPFDSLTGDPKELGSKSIWVRLQIFAAGALMNLIFVFPICVAMYLVGKVEALPVVGEIEPGSSEWVSGLQKGDILLSVDGKAVRSIQEYREVAILSDPGTKLSVRVLRPPAGALARWDQWLTLAPEGQARGLSDLAAKGPLFVRHAGTGLAPRCEGAKEATLEVVTAGSEGYGASPFTFPIVGTVEKGSAADKVGLVSGDQVLQFGGTPLRGFGHLKALVLENADKQIDLLVRSADGKERTVRPMPIGRTVRVLAVEEVMAAVAGSVKGGSPGAAAGILGGDTIVAVNGEETPTWDRLVKTVQPLAGQQVKVKVRRGDAPMEFDVTVGTDAETGKGMLGVTVRYGDTFADVPAQSIWETAGFKPGDVLKQVGGKDVKNGFLDLSNAGTLSKEGESIEVVVSRGGTATTLKVTPAVKKEGTLGVSPKVITIEKRYPFGEAVGTGLGDGTRFMQMTLLMFKKLFLGHESTKGLAGPIGIVKSSYQVAQEGLGNFLWFLGLITVSLGVFNLLPIPLLDGGHITLMLVGAIRGKPLSEKALNRALWAGLILIGTLIIFVTYNDITR